MAHRNRCAAKPFSVRLTETEHVRLKAQAGAKPLGLYLRERLLGATAGSRRSRKAPQHDTAPMAQALAALGQSDIATSLGDLALLAGEGAIAVDDEITRRLIRACEAVAEIHGLLVTALEKAAPQKAKALGSVTLSTTFNESASGDQ